MQKKADFRQYKEERIKMSPQGTETGKFFFIIPHSLGFVQKENIIYTECIKYTYFFLLQTKK